MKIVFALLTMAVALTAPSAASAAELSYALSPQGAAGYRASWRMLLNPTPTQAVEGQGFAIERVGGTFPRSSGGDAYIDFFSGANGGGLTIADADGPWILTTLFGAQLYSGSEAAPTMARGVFALSTNRAGGSGYTLTVTDVSSAVPEPGTWMLMIGGFGAIGAALRRRQRARPSDVRSTTIQGFSTPTVAHGAGA